MGLMKRKRSDSELSMTGSQFSSPPHPNDNSFTFFSSMSMMDMDGSSRGITSPSRMRSATPSHLPGRTMKRFRDNRPSDEEVHRKFYEWRAHHKNPDANTCLPPNGSQRPDSCSPIHRLSSAEHTLGLLYRAQNNANAFTNGGAATTSTTPTVSSKPVQQQQQMSLHRFFAIPGSEPSSAGSSVPAVVEPRNCEDCGTNLCQTASSDDAMDVDGAYGMSASPSDCGCVACGKLVCSQCSVSNMGEQRHCLVCTGSKVWIGGIGWTQRSVGVC